MFTMFRKKSISQVPPTGAQTVDGESQLAVRASDGVAAVTERSDYDYTLVGIGEVDQNCFLRYLPQADLTNAFVGLNFISNTTNAVGDIMSAQAPAPMTRTRFITGTLSWGLSVGAQLLKYFQKFRELQTAQNDLLDSIPMDQITSCFATVRESDSVTRTFTLEDELNGAAFTPAAIKAFATRYGRVTIQFRTLGVTLDVYDFGIFTKRVGGVAAGTTLLTAAAGGINFGYFFAEQAGWITEDQAAVLDLAADIGKNLPLISACGRLSEMCNGYTQNFKDQLDQLVIELYIKPRVLHTLPSLLLDVLGRYTTEAQRKQNIARLEFFKKEAQDPAALEAGMRRRLTITNRRG